MQTLYILLKVRVLTQYRSTSIFNLFNNVGHWSHSVTTAVLNADIETLTAFKDTIEVAPVKAVFESIIVILTLVKVRFLLFPLLHPLIGDTTRAR